MCSTVAKDRCNTFDETIKWKQTKFLLGYPRTTSLINNNNKRREERIHFDKILLIGRNVMRQVEPQQGWKLDDTEQGEN